jgi:hypothetical protein
MLRHRLSGLAVHFFALLLGMFPGSAYAQSNNDSGDAGSAALLIFCCGVPAITAVLVVIWMNRNRKPYLTGTQTPMTVDQMLQTAVQAYTIDGYQVTSHTAGNVTFTKQTRPNMGFVILLLITGILPGIVYWVLANRPFSVNVVGAQQASFTTVNITSSVTGFGAKTTADKLVASLPKPAGMGAATVPPFDASSKKW